MYITQKSWNSKIQYLINCKNFLFSCKLIRISLLRQKAYSEVSNGRKLMPSSNMMFNNFAENCSKLCNLQTKNHVGLTSYLKGLQCRLLIVENIKDKNNKFSWTFHCLFTIPTLKRCFNLFNSA